MFCLISQPNLFTYICIYKACQIDFSVSKLDNTSWIGTGIRDGWLRVERPTDKANHTCCQQFTELQCKIWHLPVTGFSRPQYDFAQWSTTKMDYVCVVGLSAADLCRSPTKLIVWWNCSLFGVSLELVQKPWRYYTSNSSLFESLLVQNLGCSLR